MLCHIINHSSILLFYFLVFCIIVYIHVYMLVIQLEEHLAG